MRRPGVEERLGPVLGREEVHDPPVDAEVEVLGVGQVLEEDDDRRATEVVGDEVLADEGGGGELPLERLDLVGRGRNAGKQAGSGREIGRRVDDVRDAEHALHARDLRERVGHAGNLQDGRGGEHVVGADADHPHVVAPEDRTGGVVVRNLRVARGQHALERILDADVERVEPQHHRHGHVGDHDGRRVTREPPREGLHEDEGFISTLPARAQGSSTGLAAPQNELTSRPRRGVLDAGRRR